MGSNEVRVRLIYSGNNGCDLSSGSTEEIHDKSH